MGPSFHLHVIYICPFKVEFAVNLSIPKDLLILPTGLPPSLCSPSLGVKSLYEDITDVRETLCIKNST